MNNRRNFLKKMAYSSAALFIAEKIYADPYDLYIAENHNNVNLNKSIIKISGYVKSGKRGLEGVAVSDGISVVSTDSTGFYSLISDNQQQFVFVSLPSGYSIPQNAVGTARFYQEIHFNKDEQNVDFNLKAENESDAEHTFLVLADPQTLDMNDINLLHTQTVPDVNKLLSGISGNVFGVACGDIMFDKLELYPQYEKAVKQMGLPCFQVFGNHDAEVAARTDELSVRTFQKYFGPTYYSFNKGEIHYIILDDVFWYGGYIGYISQPQLDWLANDLKFVEKGKTVVVFAHIPIYSHQYLRYNQKSPSNSLVVTNRELLYKLLEQYKTYLICGHTHESEFISDNNCEIHVGGAVCGAWWSGPICFDGTPNGYSVYSVKGSNLKWKYKSTGYDFTHQMRLYKKDNILTANVWNANKDWKISLYESGNKIVMNPTPGLDPLSVELHQGDSKPKKHSWVEPIPTNHLYSTKFSHEAKELIVEAVDQWGNTYTEKLL